MRIINTLSLESNRQIKINFAGGDLSSDVGLLLIKEFTCKLGFVKLLKSLFKTNDTAFVRQHKDDENLWQVIYQILGAYFEDDCADEPIRFYCKSGSMENLIKESKNSFDFTAVSSSSNANRLQVHTLAYNIFNYFKRLVLPAKMCKQQIDTIRLKLLNIAAKAIHSATYITFKLCGSCPYKDEFYETLENIRVFQPQLE